MDEIKSDRGRKSAQTKRRRQLTGQLAAGVAHDFNNLLATILGSLELMERRVGLLPEPEQDRFRTLIQRSIDAVQRAGNVTAKLLAFSRRQPEGPAALDVNRLLADLLVLASGSIGRRIQITTEFAPDLPPVSADPVRLETVLVQLLLNAREAMPDGGRLFIATAREQAASITITVSHDGPGAQFAEHGIDALVQELKASLRLVESRASLYLPVAKH